MPLGNGLIEVVDAAAATAADFASFKAAVQQNNATLQNFPVSTSYTTRAGTRIDFTQGTPSIARPQLGVAGSVVSAPRAGVIAIRNPRDGKVLVLDLSDETNPRRYEQ